MSTEENKAIVRRAFVGLWKQKNAGRWSLKRPALLVLGCGLLLATLVSVPLHAAGPQVLLVGSYHGMAGQFPTIQAAVNAAHPGDWILIAPGDYHEQGSRTDGVLVTTPNLHLRGLDRNGVIVDGTLPDAAACSSDPALQNFGASGRNGIQVFKTDGVSVENLTVCNFLSDNSGSNGNEVWFNGGDGSGTIGLGSFQGRYLTASSTYYKDDFSAQAIYGLFASNVGGPGLFEQDYASNMGDSSFYVGACPDCHVVLSRVHAQNSPLGYSGTNSGGHLLIENSEWDQNKIGILPNSFNNDDWPSPQNGACPAGQMGPTGTASCTVIRGNYAHDNNNPNVPQFGLARNTGVGVGIDIAGGENDTVTDNRVTHNGLYGILIFDLPDPETPPLSNPHPCSGGLQLGSLCYFVGYGNEVTSNFLMDNGFFGNVTNGDLADSHIAHTPGNCWHGNFDPHGLTSAPANIQTTMGTCGVANQGDATVETLGLCESGLDAEACAALPPLHFPAETGAVLLPIPRQQSMPDPCAGVPANAWCGQSSHRNPSTPINMVFDLFFRKEV